MKNKVLRIIIIIIIIDSFLSFHNISKLILVPNFSMEKRFHLARLIISLHSHTSTLRKARMELKILLIDGNQFLQMTQCHKLIKISMSSLVCKVRKLDKIFLAPLKNNSIITCKLFGRLFPTLQLLNSSCHAGMGNVRCKLI